MSHQSLLAWICWADSNPLNFLWPWISPWSERKIWQFLKVAISLKPEKPCPPKLVCMHVMSIPTCMNFYLILFFDLYGLYNPWSERKIWPKMDVSKTGKTTPTIIGVHALHINAYLHEFFEPILINFFDTWTIVHGLKEITNNAIIQSLLMSFPIIIVLVVLLRTTSLLLPSSFVREKLITWQSHMKHF